MSGAAGERKVYVTVGHREASDLLRFMDPSEPCQKLIAAARALPPDERVPYAFEKRVMARLAGGFILDPWTLWGQGLARAAVLCVAVTLLLAASSFLLPSRKTQATTLPEAVGQALLAGLDTSSEQVEDTP